MPGQQHRAIAAGQIHSPFNWLVADADGLAALAVTADDLYKVALRLDIGASFALVEADPVAWVQVGLSSVTKAQVGLGNVDNTSDANKPVSTAQQAAIQSSALIAAAAGGTANAITAAYTPAITALVSGMTLHVRAASANTTTTPTFTPNSGTIAAKTIVKGNGLALAAGDIAGAGHWIELQYDATLDKWVLQNPSVATAANDAAGTDNSTRTATTGWIRNAMSAIATAAGFSGSFGASGYIKFPSWLGNWVVEWCPWTLASIGSTSGVSTVGVTFPLVFPTACYAAFSNATNYGSASSWSGFTSFAGVPTTSGVVVSVGYPNNTPSGSTNGYVFAIGK